MLPQVQYICQQEGDIVLHLHVDNVVQRGNLQVVRVCVVAAVDGIV